MIAKENFLMIRDSLNKVAANLPANIKPDPLPLELVLRKNGIEMPATIPAIEAFIANCDKVVEDVNKTTEGLPAPISVALHSGPRLNGSRIQTVYFFTFERKE